ncbi:hypothetical protein [Micromonospora sp. CPCC 206061]|uniref:hypothetical protein n=1 Tax=Micromonospora sp. CPCC 206061 TaxID=3122410 RepID=UPI002FF08B39
MWSVPRRLAASAALVVCVAAGLAALPTPAAATSPAATTRAAVTSVANLAAASCYIVCDDTDPNTARYENSDGALVRCNGYRTVYVVSNTELRYSTSCRMAWARGNGYSPIKIESFNADGTFRTSRERTSCPVGPPACPSQIYTVALNDAGLTARACVYSPSEGWRCTARY